MQLNFKPLLKCLLLTFLFSFLNFSYANDNFFKKFWLKTRGHYYAGVQLGYLLNPIKQTTTIPPLLPELNPQEFDTDGGASNLIEFGIRGGYITPLTERWSLQTGLAYYLSTQENITGDYYSIAAPPPDQTYSYNFSMQRIMVEARALWQANTHWGYFGGLALGIASLHTSALQFTAIPYSGSSSTPLTSSSRTTTQGAYGIVAGVDYTLTAQWHLEAGLSQLWLGNLTVPVNSGVSNMPVSMGSINPTQLWLGARYLF